MLCRVILFVLLFGNLALADPDPKSFPFRIDNNIGQLINLELSGNFFESSTEKKPLVNWSWLADVENHRALPNSIIGELFRLGGSKTPTHVIATRYTTPGGDVHGDGRTITLKNSIVEQMHRGHAVLDLQIQGLKTGLRRDGIQSRENGQKRLDHALRDLLMTTVLGRSGLRAGQVLSIVQNNEGTTQLTRAGNFQRFAHVLGLGNDSKAVRHFFDELNQTIKVQLGRSKNFNYISLYRHLIERAAMELSDLYWLRLVHGGVSYDNIGFLQILDVESMSAVDRPHPTYTPVPQSPGFGREGAFVMGQFYVAELREMLLIANTSKSEQRAIENFDAESFAKNRYFEHMARRMLNHVGFDRDVASLVLKRAGKDAVMEMLDIFLEYTESTNPNPTIMGPEGLNKVNNPARYDMFQALSSLVEISVSSDSDRIKKNKLLQALRPERRNERDIQVASEILVTFAPILEAALIDVDGEARAERQHIFIREAHRINKPTPKLMHAQISNQTETWAKKLQSGSDPNLIFNKIQELARLQLRKGDTSPFEIVQKLRRRQLAIAKDGTISLTSHSDAYFHVDEKSNGEKDWFEITISDRFSFPQQINSLKIEMNSNGEQQEKTVFPQKGSTDKQRPLFIVAAIHKMDRLVIHAEGKNRPATKFLFRPALGSPLLDAELAIWAKTRGKSRQSTSDARRDAMQNIAANLRRRKARKKVPVTRKAYRNAH